MHACMHIDLPACFRPGVFIIIIMIIIFISIPARAPVHACIACILVGFLGGEKFFFSEGDGLLERV